VITREPMTKANRAALMARLTALAAIAASISSCSNLADDCNRNGQCGGPNDAGSGGTHAGGTANATAGGTSASGGTGIGGITSIGGTATGGAPSACSPACSGTKAVCNESAKTCVECLGDSNCLGNKPACDTSTHTCVQCIKDENCAAASPACDAASCPGATLACNTANNTCVQCMGNGNCSGDTPLCDSSSHSCVECLAPTDCMKPGFSACINGTCEPCLSNADCSHISGKGVCKESSSGDADAGASTDAGTISDAGVGTGLCVQCTGTQYSACGQSNGKNLVCDSQTNTCSTNTEHSAGLCKTCVSDAQCPLGEMCVDEQFNGKSVGYFCFYRQGDTGNGAPASCFSNGRPYSGVLKNAVSIDGQMADICSLRVSTCPALNQFSQTNCTSATSTANENLCGFAPGVDSKCVETTTAGVFSCTVTCGNDIDCRLGFSCDTGVNPPVCGLQ
jgi:hypothetical protein